MSEFAFATGAARPRKQPAQARSQDTVEAILTATVRVLAEHGAALTTTRVAEVAGVSVGTLYQCFPNREALITGVLADHLEVVIRAVEAAATEARDLPRAAAAEHLTRAFLAAKAARIETSLLLDRVFGVGKLDDRPVVHAAVQRAQRAIAQLLPDLPDGAAHQRAGVIAAALEGVVRAALAEDPRRLADPAWQAQVVALAIAAF